MATALFGLNPYSKNARTEMGFSNFQWVITGKLARSSQPGYTGHDGVQNLSLVQVAFLRLKGIRCIVSANEYGITPESSRLLQNANIVHHHYSIKDYTAPTRYQLQNATDVIQTALSRGVAVLVHCGFGQGRTGTVVAGWAMRWYMPAQPRPTARPLNIDALCNADFCKANFGVETATQLNAVREAAALPVLDVVPDAPAAPAQVLSGLPLPTGSANSWTGPRMSSPPPFFTSGSSNLGPPNSSSGSWPFGRVNSGD